EGKRPPRALLRADGARPETTGQRGSALGGGRGRGATRPEAGVRRIGMSWIGRFGNFFRRGRVDAEIEEELASHIEEAIEQGRSPEEARKGFGGELLQRERSRDIKLLPWLDALAADVVFGWRQLRKRPAVSAAAILSLALAIGATTAAFRLIDAVLL